LASRPRPAWQDDLASSAKPLTTRQTPASILVRDGDVSMRFGKASGAIEELWIGQRNLLQGPLAPNFWRAPTDDDAVRDPSVMSQDIWRDAAPGRKVDAVTLKTTDGERRAIVRVKGTMLGGKCPYEILYQVVAGVGLRARMAIRPDPSLPPLPRVGMRMTLEPTCTRMQWLGRGPQENYQDRLGGARVAFFRGSALSLGFDYARPQENGNRCDVRWAAWQDPSGIGALVARGATGFLNVSAHPYSLEQLEHARHDGDLPRLGPIEVAIDAKQQGVGGGSSWDWRAKPLPQYRIPAKPMAFDFLLVPLTAGRKDLAALACQPLPDFPAADGDKP
jgi:beta-galactosidase